MREQPAGWYRDTEQPNLHRYWSGQGWSDSLGEELALAERAYLPEQRQEPGPGELRIGRSVERSSGR